MAAGPSQSPIRCNEGSLQDFRESDIGSIEGGEIRSQLPNSGQEWHIGVPEQTQRFKVVQSFAGSARRQFFTKRISSQGLNHLGVEYEGDVKRLPGPSKFLGNNCGVGLNLK